MIKIMFVCHGNICRSPMAEFVMKDMVNKRGLSDKIYIASSATSTEELGNDIHYGTRKKLTEEKIPFNSRKAVQLRKSDYSNYDYLIGMDKRNIRNMLNIVGSDSQDKIKLLLEFAGINRDIADPWYTGNFDDTYNDVILGCKNLLSAILPKI